MHMFTEPNQQSTNHVLIFDFPVGYHATGTRPNQDYNQTPAKEALYGLVGVPAKEQGHPHISEEFPPEAEDAASQDQIVDADRRIVICHTGRLSGSFAQYLAHDGYVSRIKVYAHPLTGGGAPILLHTHNVDLQPQPQAPNVWYWRNPATLAELLQSVRVDVDAGAAGLDREEVYKLVSKWEFWDVRRPGNERRMPISGFDDAVSFNVINATQNV